MHVFHLFIFRLGWHNFLQDPKRMLWKWIELLEKESIEKIPNPKPENYHIEDFSDSDDNMDIDDIWDRHLEEGN